MLNDYTAMEEFMIFSGEAEVKDDAFYFQFDRFIIRDKEIAFELNGNEDDNTRFQSEGIARLSSTGIYESSFIVNYSNYANAKASMMITNISFSPKNHVCTVSGSWHEGGTSLPFTARLSRTSK